MGALSVPRLKDTLFNMPVIGRNVPSKALITGFGAWATKVRLYGRSLIWDSSGVTVAGVALATVSHRNQRPGFLTRRPYGWGFLKS